MDSPILCWMEGALLSSALDGAVVQQDAIIRPSDRPTCWVASDSLSFKAAIKFFKDNSGSNFTFTLTSNERAMSSGLRELLAIYKMMLHAQKVNLLQEKSIIWLTDSTNVVSFWNKGSSVKAVQSVVFDLVKLVKNMRCDLQILHLRRSDPRIVEVDQLSKEKDSDNWSLDYQSFTSLMASKPCEVDLFADASNARLAKYVSRFYDEKALATDGFTISWDIGTLWICPPVGEVAKIIRKIQGERCSGILIAPDWPAANFYTLVFDQNTLKRPFYGVTRLRPYICQNEKATRTPLFGYTDFEMLALFFKNQI